MFTPFLAAWMMAFASAWIVATQWSFSIMCPTSLQCGMPHCSDVGHMMENDHCVATIHAEANAIIQAAKNGVNIDGATIYVTASPCWSCFKMVVNGGIRRICYGEFYRDDRIFEVAQ